MFSHYKITSNYLQFLLGVVLVMLLTLYNADQE